jgi:hypothetical protein
MTHTSEASGVSTSRAATHFRIGLIVWAVLTALYTRAADTTNSTASAVKPSATGPGKANAESAVDTLVRYAMPGPEHKLLNRIAGQWTVVVRYWMAAGAEPVESKGTCTRKWILGERFLLEELDGGNLALPFQGLGLYGYDSFEAKYTSAWLDTMNTSILTNLGTFDEAQAVVNFVGQYKDPWTGTKKNERGVLRFLGPDLHRLELHLSEKEGQEFKMLEMVYSRKTSAGP